MSNFDFLQGICVFCYCFLVGLVPVSGQTLIDPTVTSQDNFGASVAIDGSRILVGARRDDTVNTNVGQVHLFNRTTANLIRTFDDPNPTNQDNFGAAVAMSSNVVLVGAPQDSTLGILVGQAYAFDAITGALLREFDDPTPGLSDFFGTSIAAFGNRVVIGAPGDDSLGSGVGQAHLFEASTGNLVATLNDPTITGFDGFGQSIAIQGSIIVVGEPGDDSNGFGVGQVHLFSASDGSFLRTLNDPTITTGDSFGYSVDVDQDLVVVGAPEDDFLGENSGQVYVFRAADGQLLQTINHPRPASGNQFGFSVSLDDGRVLIGSPSSVDGEAIGQAFLFDARSGQLLDTLSGSNRVGDDDFGFSVGLSDAFAIVGSPLNDLQGNDVGRAEVFGVNTVLVGDINLDGDVNLLDVAPFVQLITSGGFQLEADINQDGSVDLLDVSPFVFLLLI